MKTSPEQCAVASLPPFNPVSLRLLDVLSKEDAVVEQVAELLRLDSAFVAEILRLANSPVFGFQNQIRTLAHVVVLLGTKRLKALIATISLKRSSGASEALEGFWRHSVASAFVAAELAEPYGVHPDSAYTAALLHDIRMWGWLSGCVAPEWHEPAGCSEVVHWACHISDALGFQVTPAPPPGGGGFLEQLPEPVRSHVDPKLLTRVVQEKLIAINN